MGGDQRLCRCVTAVANQVLHPYSQVRLGTLHQCLARSCPTGTHSATLCHLTITPVIPVGAVTFGITGQTHISDAVSHLVAITHFSTGSLCRL